MPNKFYLREDRKAVKSEKITKCLHGECGRVICDCGVSEKPYNEPRDDDFETYPLPICFEKGEEQRELYRRKMRIDEDKKYWHHHLASLPALDVDPDYLKTLRPGWFEGVERYEHTNGIGIWLECSKEDYDTSYPNLRRLTIVAPQEAEKGQEEGIEWCKGYEVGFKKGGKAHAVLFHKWMINDQPNLFGNDTEAMETFYDSYGKDDLTLSDWYEYWVNKYRPAPATPQPVTGEAVEFDTWLGKERDAFVVSILEAPWNTEQRVQAENILIAFDQARERLRSASRPSDAVASQEHREEVERLKARVKELEEEIKELRRVSGHGPLYDKIDTLKRELDEQEKIKAGMQLAIDSLIFNK